MMNMKRNGTVKNALSRNGGYKHVVESDKLCENENGLSANKEKYIYCFGSVKINV